MRRNPSTSLVRIKLARADQSIHRTKHPTVHPIVVARHYRAGCVCYDFIHCDSLCGALRHRLGCYRYPPLARRLSCVGMHESRKQHQLASGAPQRTCLLASDASGCCFRAHACWLRHRHRLIPGPASPYRCACPRPASRQGPRGCRRARPMPPRAASQCRADTSRGRGPEPPRYRRC